MSAPVVLEGRHAFGYRSLEEFPEDSRENLGGYIYAFNILNAASIALSPIIGIIRLLGSFYAYIYVTSSDQKDLLQDKEGVKNYWKMQMVRGGLEVLFLGIILGTVVDGAIMLKNQSSPQDESLNENT